MIPITSTKSHGKSNHIDNKKITLRKIVCIMMLLSLLNACKNNSQENKYESESPSKYMLKGTQWTSDFYYYHNNYYFETDSTGYSQDGQFLWSTPIDPTLYSNSKDSNSISYANDEHFIYSLIDTVLTIKYLSADHDSINDHRVFYLQKQDSNKIIFMSDYEYTYGHEFLILKTSSDK